VLAFRDRHEIARAPGIEVYVRNLRQRRNARFAIVHVGKCLARSRMTARWSATRESTRPPQRVQRPGDPAKALLIDTARETLRGDRLLSADASGTPGPPFRAACASERRARPHHRRVGGTELAGQYAGGGHQPRQRHGLEPGNVLAVDQAGDVVRDLYPRRPDNR